MDKMENSIDNKGLWLGKKDKIMDFNSKWPIFRLNILDKRGLWWTFKEKMNELNMRELLKTVTYEEVEQYYHLNSDIDFEINFFDFLLQKHHLFKFKDKVLSYSIGKLTKNTKNIIYVRFFFDVNKFISY